MLAAPEKGLGRAGLPLCSCAMGRKGCLSVPAHTLSFHMGSRRGQVGQGPCAPWRDPQGPREVRPPGSPVTFRFPGPPSSPMAMQATFAFKAFFIYPFLFILKAERKERDRDLSCAGSRQCWVRPEPGAKVSIWVSTWGAGTPMFEPPPACLLGRTLAGAESEVEPGRSGRGRRRPEQRFNCCVSGHHTEAPRHHSWAGGRAGETLC